jgi:hypothetical protein
LILVKVGVKEIWKAETACFQGGGSHVTRRSRDFLLTGFDLLVEFSYIVMV